MPATFSGSRIKSLRQRVLANGQHRLSLDRNREECGDVFWYHPKTFASKVLVVFDPIVVAGILKEESWMFCKALEPWHNRQTSHDAYERLLCDGLLLADGNYHKKRSAQFTRKLDNKYFWQRLQLRIGDNINRLTSKDEGISVDTFVRQLIRDALEIYSNILFDDDQFDRFIAVLNRALSSHQKQQHCPFINKQRKSSRALRQSIDEIRTFMMQQNEQQKILDDNANKSLSVSLSSKAHIDEALVIAVALSNKLPVLLISALKYYGELDPSLQQQIISEGEASIDEPKHEQIEKGCPDTYRQLMSILSSTSNPIDVIKRFTVCDTMILDVHIPESVEIWIPTWSSDTGLLFGDGRYACKGEEFSLAIATRVLQWFCCDSFKLHFSIN